jgi:5-methyltetrahydrofolate--homocysteine methyltransferase
MPVSMDDVRVAVCEGRQDRVVELVQKALKDNLAADRILRDGLIPGMQSLGDQFRDGQAFLPEIMISARAMRAALSELRPHLAPDAIADQGTVVLGTVAGDLHDIGKSLVGMLLEGNGFRVIDLGVDVSAPEFAAAARDYSADIVALSALLTTTTPQFCAVIKSLDDTGMRDRVKVLIGGAPVSRALADEVGAEGFAEECVSAVDEAKRLLGRGAS